jgi:predicted DCC family thiol-disulfide oxidoreductase YuxK
LDVGDGRDIVFYDGACGLCHWLVKFILPRDQVGVFRFAPLDSDVFRASVPEPERARLPDSVVVKTSDGRVLVRAAGTQYILGRLGSFWRVVGLAMGVVPRGVADWVYDRVARVRHRLFKRPEGVCPIVPEEWRGRFLS